MRFTKSALVPRKGAWAPTRIATIIDDHHADARSNSALTTTATSVTGSSSGRTGRIWDTSAETERTMRDHDRDDHDRAPVRVHLRPELHDGDAEEHENREIEENRPGSAG